MAKPVVTVEGLRETLRTLDRLGADAADMRDVMHRVGLLVARTAEQLVPRRTGRLAGTIRAGRAKARATVRAGSAGVPYAGVIHWGWPARNIAAQPFLLDAAERRRREVVSLVDDGLAQLITKLALDRKVDR